MDDLISRKELLNEINAYVVGSQDKEFICKLIKGAPSAQHKPFCYLDSPCPYQNEEIKVTERKKGHWIDGSCSVCGCDEPMFIEDWNVEHCKTPFCPNCGAYMRGAGNV